MKKNLENNRGITLIALVVTIIILLILAAVSLSLVFNSDGLFSKANEAATKWNNSKEDEEDFLEQATNNIDKYWNEYGENEKTLVAMFKKAQEDNCLDGKNCNNPGEHVHVGDYVTNYNSTLKNVSAEARLLPEETGMITNPAEEERITQVYKVDTATTWRVAGLSKDGTQLIITTGSPIKKQMDTIIEDVSNTQKEINIMRLDGRENYRINTVDLILQPMQNTPYLYLKGAEGWYHTNDELTDDNILDRASKIYDSRYASKIASMRIEDIETLLGLSIEKNGANTKAYKINGTNRTDITEAFEHLFGQSHTYINGEYAPENYLKEKYPSNSKYANLQIKSAGNSVPGSAYAYQITNSKVVDQSSKIFEILFKDTTAAPFSKSYWLASSGVYLGDGNCYFGPGAVDYGYAGRGGNGLFGSDGNADRGGLAVRPVVYLQSKVTTNELTISPNGSEETWSFSAGEGPGEQVDAGQIGGDPS